MRYHKGFMSCIGLLLMAACQLGQSGTTTPQTPPAIRRQLIDKREVAGAPELESQLWLIEYPPAAAAPLHHHPVVGIGYVIEGEFESAFEGEAPVRVRAGQSFVDPALKDHRLFRNTSADHALKFVVAYAIPRAWPVVVSGPSRRVQLQSSVGPIAIAMDALYPETIELNPLTGKFLVGSVREGAVFEVGLDGVPKKLVRDERLISVLGIAVDRRSHRLLVTNSDLGASLKHSSRGARKEAGVGIYDLSSGQLLHYVDLAALLPDGDHLINGITVDGDGNAYATDSFSPVIYKIDSTGNAQIFLQSESFAGAGINLNGIVFDDRGFLVAINKRTGELYRIPLDDPQHFSRVRMSQAIAGGDGLLLIEGDTLLVVANQTPTAAANAAFVLKSRDDWASAELQDQRELGSVYPTTAVAQDGKLYVLSSHLDEWIGAQAETRDAIAAQARRAEIRELGVLAN